LLHHATLNCFLISKRGAAVDFENVKCAEKDLTLAGPGEGLDPRGSPDVTLHGRCVVQGLTAGEVKEKTKTLKEYNPAILEYCNKRDLTLPGSHGEGRDPHGVLRSHCFKGAL